MEKENQKKQRELKKSEQGQKSKQNNTLAKPDNKQTETRGKRKQCDKENTENYCGYCEGYYFDSDDEYWVKCTAMKCNAWYHESCAGILGNGLQSFKCSKHA